MKDGYGANIVSLIRTRAPEIQKNEERETVTVLDTSIRNRKPEPSLASDEPGNYSKNWGIYQINLVCTLTCKSSPRSYVGGTGRSLKMRKQD